MASPLATESVSSPPSLSSGTTPGSQAMSPTESGAHTSNSHGVAHNVYKNTALPAVNMNGKIALPPQSQMPVSAPVGPASRVYTIPPRPKPGRKPKEPAADDVRKEQNRAAQKKFRNKQHDKIQALSEEADQKDNVIRSLQAEVNNLNNALANAHAQIEASRQQLLALEADRASERASFKRKADELERESKRARTKRPRSGDMTFDTMPIDIRPSFSTSDVNTTHIPSNPTPPHEPMEMDFTNWAQPSTHDANDDDCGFCGDGDFCACSMKIKSSTETAIDTAPPAPPAVVSLKRRNHPAAPGSCEACQRDPEQRAKCMELARETVYSPTPPTSGTMLGIKAGPDGLLNEAPPSERTSCSDFLAKFRPLNGTAYRSIITKLHTFPHMDRPGHEAGPYKPALDLDAREAAEALTSLAAKPERH